MGIKAEDVCKVTFRSLIDGSSVSIVLYSKLTCLYGEYSGEGKSHFFSVVADGISGSESGEKTISVELSKSSWKFSVAYAATIETSLELSDARYVFLIDEASMLSNSVCKKIKSSKHVFICITRAMPLRMGYSLKGIYSLIRTCTNAEVSFDIVKDNNLPLFTEIKGTFDYIVTEASCNHSENELLGVYLPGLIAANGRDRIEKVLLQLTKRKGDCKILVFADLGNIGQAYGILIKRCHQNKNIYFYNYACFEQLLYTSNLVRGLGTGNTAIDKFSVLTLEKYYSNLLEEVTKGSLLEYKHGKPLADGYKDKRNYTKVFSSTVSKMIKSYIDYYRE